MDKVQNHVTKVKELAKANFPSLWRLAIRKIFPYKDENKIIDGESLTISSFKVKNLSFDLVTSEKHKCEDVRFVLKLVDSPHYLCTELMMKG